jgi:hypothetical protein
MTFVCMHYNKNSFILNRIILKYRLNDKLTKGKFTFEQATKAQMGSKSISLLFL